MTALPARLPGCPPACLLNSGPAAAQELQRLRRVKIIELRAGGSTRLGGPGQSVGEQRGTGQKPKRRVEWVGHSRPTLVSGGFAAAKRVGACVGGKPWVVGASGIARRRGGCAGSCRRRRARRGGLVRRLVASAALLQAQQADVVHPQ